MFWLAIAIAAIVVAALAVPVQLDVAVELSDRWRGHVTLRWLFGALAVPLRGGRAKSPETSRHRAPRRRRPIGPLLTSPGFTRRLLQLVLDLIDQVRVRSFRLDAAFGFDDPADTGRLYGAIAPALAMASARGLRVRCRPDFSRATLHGSCAGSVAMTPLPVAGVALGFLLSSEARRAWRAWRHSS